MKKTIQLITAFALMSAAQSHASLALYDFASGSFDSVDTDTDTTAGALSVGSGLTPFTNDAANSFDGGPSLGGSLANFGFSTNGSLATAISNNDYISFSLDAGANTVDFTQLTFQLRANGGGANSANEYAVFSDIGGFTLGSDIASGAHSGAADFELQTLDLTSLTNVTGETEFRIYLFGANGGGANSATIYDNIDLQGTVTVVPEPTSTALLGLGACALFLRRRRA